MKTFVHRRPVPAAFATILIVCSGMATSRGEAKHPPEQPNTVKSVNAQLAEVPSMPFKPDSRTQQRAGELYGKLPLSFEANQGQADNEVKFISRGSGYSLFLTSTEAVLALQKRAEKKDRKDSMATNRIEEASAANPPVVVRMKLAGANPEAQVTGREELPGKTNYFIGNDPAHWRTDIPTYARVQYKEVYPGIDLVYYGNQQQLEYDFIVGSGSDPGSIKLTFEGASNVRVDDQGDLLLTTAGGEIRQRAPLIYQEVDGVRREISGGYTFTGNQEVGFHIGKYDTSKPLVIDPVLSYSTYFGLKRVYRSFIAVDSSGNAYITGTVGSEQDGQIPTKNPLFPFTGYIASAFVAKLNAAGSALIYSTYLGGNGPDDAFGIALDSSGNAYVMGHTDSTNFPTINPFQANAHNANGPCTSYNRYVQCRELFVTRLNATGSALVYSTYLGGTGIDYAFGGGIAVDSSGNAYLTGATESGDFPTTNNAFQGAGPSFLTKLNTNASGAGSLIYSTYLPTYHNYSGGLAVDSSGTAYVIGEGVFPATEKAFQTSGGILILKLNTNPSTCTPDSNANVLCRESLLYSTYLGGNLTDRGHDIAVDSSDHVYVTGSTNSTDFPTTPGAFQPAAKDDGTGAVQDDCFVTKLNTNPPICTPDVAGNVNCKEALVYSTYLGGSGRDEGSGIALDASGNFYVTGETSSSDFPVKAPFQLHKGGNDAFVAKLNPNGFGAESLVYSTYLGGGTGQDYRTSIAVDSVGDAYVTGITHSADFPTTPGSLDPKGPELSGNFPVAFVSKISDDTRTFLVSAIGPSTGGDTGSVSAIVYGRGFTSGSTVKLSRAGQPDIAGDFVTVTGDGQIDATFYLVEKERGLWDVVVTNPDGASTIFPGRFTIEAGRLAPGTISIIGRENFRAGGTGRIVVTYGNPGNVDALLPILIRIPTGIGFSFPVPILHRPLVPTSEPVDFSGLATSFQRPDNPDTPQDESETIIPLIVNVPPGFTGSIPINLQHPNTNCSGVTIRASVGDAVNSNAACFGAVAELAAEILTDIIPGADCLKEAFELLVKANTSLYTRQPATLSSWIASFLLGAANCAVDFTPFKAIKIAVEVTDLLIGKGGSLVEFYNACSPAPVFQPTFIAPGTVTLTTACVGSKDPNDKSGSKGAGPDRYVTGEAALPYLILFENKPDATAPAQDVVITDQLDTENLDYATFSLGPIAFGDQMVVPPPGLTDYSAEVDLRPAKDLIVRIKAKLEVATGLLTWRFASIDPATGQPTDDPVAGFLPPNKNPPEGDGAVFFTVKPKAGLVTGTEIRNRASIVFDINEAIDTPEWFNTIGSPSQLLNIATRLRVQTGENVLIGGFIITGTDPKEVIIRGIGPSLGQFFNGALSDPTLELLQGDTQLASNDNWREAQAVVAATGIPPSNDLESAIVRTLAPGAYTAILRGKGDATGIGLVEIYDLDQEGNAKLANISTRGFVEPADNVMIGGLIIGGGGGLETRVLVRAIGPSLGDSGVAGSLQDPTLELRNGNGALVDANDNWRSDREAEIEATTIPPLRDEEAAIVRFLAPGAYTAIVRGKNNTTGVALVEVYNLSP